MTDNNVTPYSEGTNRRTNETRVFRTPCPFGSEHYFTSAGVGRPVYHISSHKYFQRRCILVSRSLKKLSCIIPRPLATATDPLPSLPAASSQHPSIRLSFSLWPSHIELSAAAWILAYGQEYLWYYLAKLE